MTTTVYYPEIVYYMQVDLFAIILLCFLLYTFRRGRARHVLSDENLFIGMLFVNLALLTLDCASTLLDGHTGAAAAAWNRAIACAFYALSPMMSYFYVLYCEIKLGVSPDTFARRMRTYLMPVLLNLVLSISSLFAPVIFWIDNNNRYQRGELFPFSMVLSLLLVVMAMLEICYVMLQKKASQRRLCLPLLLFPLPPLIGAILQFFLPRLSIIWVSTVFSLLPLYLSFQNVQIMTDSLTGLYNRSQLAPYLYRKTNRIAPHRTLFLVMLDLDRFKSINDTYGHLTGDSALTEAANCIRHSLAPDDFAVRFGGDEFVVIAERAAAADLQRFFTALQQETARYNALPDRQYRLSFSFGYSVWPARGGSIDDFISQADREMYDCKQKKHFPGSTS